VSPFRLKNFSLVSEIKRIWIRFTCVSLFHYKISLLFFCFFSLIFASNFLLRFDLVIFASKGNKAKRNSSLFFRFFHFFCFFCFFSLFSTFFLFIFVSLKSFSLNFRFFYLPFRFRFLVFRIEVNHVKSGFFFASNSISNFASEAKVRAHPNSRAQTW
jgi:hypothetical protein